MLYHNYYISCQELVILYQKRYVSFDGRRANHRMDGAVLRQNLIDKQDAFINKYSYNGSYCKVEEIKDRYYNKTAKTDII